MNVAVRYYSKTGNTKKVAQEIAKQLQVVAKSIDSPLDRPVDQLFLGGAIHNASMDHQLKDYAAQLDPQKVGQVVMFGTSGAILTIGHGLEKALKANHISVSQSQLFLHGMLPNKKALKTNEREQIAMFVRRATEHFVEG
ncbi:MAG: flavodoxin family protein [Lentilactobacillus hilgardii]|uniref:flavodoxin family protein n=1 Tax=Lactobacillaceae TaxID=33958 RepID=UPI0010B3201E|nr:hypothetical protein OAL24_01632 [Oenococcus sicerae]